MNEVLTQLIYLVSTALFILSLKWMSHPSTARRGIVSGVVAMVAAIGGALIDPASWHIIGSPRRLWWDSWSACLWRWCP